MSAPARNIYHRPELATRLARLVLQVSPTSASASGVFLAAPRRTGKTTFMRQDLVPALEAAPATVIYVDLWADRKADPADVIVAALRQELARHEPALARLAKSLGIGGASIAGVQFSLDRLGLGKEISLVQGLATLSDVVRQPIVLIIDEAQQAITTASGSDVMFSLKAARDELNSAEHHGLRIVCTGSNLDKLAILRNSKDQAFFGAPVVEFPLLDEGYIAWFCANSLDLGAPLDPALVSGLFRRAAFRPEILGAAADQLRFDLTLRANEVNARFAAAVEAQIEAADNESLRVVRSLTPLQSAVLKVMAATGASFAPFEKQTMARYRAAVGDEPATVLTVDVPGVQQALLALQDKGLVWKAERGVYAIEDAALVDLMRTRGMLD